MPLEALPIGVTLPPVGEGTKPAANTPIRRVLGEGRYLTLVDDGGWEYVTRPQITGVVVIVAITDSGKLGDGKLGDGKLLLVEQWRPAVRNRVIELPAGLVGDLDADETLVVAASRELSEETGFAAREMVPLAVGPVAVGVSDEMVSFFHARHLTRVGSGGGDATESIVVHEVPLPGLRAFLAARAALGLAIDPKIYAGLFLVGAMVPA
ncbi:MAG TPA: NUDIX hydrolase [Polyangia bacterium]|jgi:ADP-ribose pyrophosphatase|nr:NUDIX hydrolase [Polyangia bacterium]